MGEDEPGDLGWRAEERVIGAGAMRVTQALAIPPLDSARVVAGRSGLGRQVRWVDVVDIPEPTPWVSPGQLLLTTGISWPAEDGAQRSLVRQLAELGLAGVALAVPHYLEHFPLASRSAADGCKLPLLELPWEVPFSTVTQALNSAIMVEQLRLIEHSATIHRALTQAAVTASSLQDLADTLARLIDRVIWLEDPEGRLLARSGPGDGAGEGPARGVLERLGYLEQLRRGTGPVRLPAGPELGAEPRVACPIWLRGELVGSVWIVEGEDELSDLHLRAAEHAATVAALHIASQRQVAMVELRLGATFLDALLEGSLPEGPHTAERARLLGFDPEAGYRVGVAALPGPLPPGREEVIRRDRLAEQLRQWLATSGGVAVTSARLNRVVFLLADGAPDALRVPGLERCALALGRPHPGAAGVQRSYREALTILAEVAPGGCRRYEEMLISRVLDGDLEARDAFLAQLFAPLRRARGGEVLVATLLALAREGFHQRRTALRLHVHPNTLRYRLERAGDLLGHDLSAPETRFQLQLAAHLEAAGRRPEA